MKASSKLLFAALIATSAGLAGAQAGGAGSGPAAGASAPRMGMGPGGGMMRGGPRWGSDYTPGWGMMSSKERDEHRAQMRAAKTPEECAALRDKHHEQMVARAKERGITMPAQPRRDACQGMKR